MHKVLGIVNFENNNIRVEGMSDYRPFSSLSFLGRYRLIDFVLSNLSNSGVKNYQLYVKERPRSVFEHVGVGLQYNINSKQGKMRVMYGEQSRVSPIYNTDITAFLENMIWIEEDHSDYVVIAPSHFVYVQDFKDVLDYHIDKNADITVLYKNTDEAKTEFTGCTTLNMDREKRVIATHINRNQAMKRQISLDAFVMKKTMFLELVKKAHEISAIYWLSDMIFDNIMDYHVVGYGVRSTVLGITDISSYYRANMKLLDPSESNLFRTDWPIYTRTSDSPPTLYSSEADVSGSLVANGVIVEGKVVNSIIGRGCKIAPTAVIENSIILPNTVIGEDVHVKYAIVDKRVTIKKTKEIQGTPEQLVYIKRSDSI